MAAAAASGDTLHWSSQGTHLLFSFIKLDYAGGFVAGSLFTAAICMSERLLTVAFESRWAPPPIRRRRLVNAFWRAGMYWVLALLRLLYMLIAMTLNVWIILIAVTTLAVGQFLIELRISPPPPRGGAAADHSYVPLEEAEAPLYSKPEGIYSPSAAGRHQKRESLGPRRAPFQMGGVDDGGSDEEP
ncbi:hypothetical protein R3P38DRAFT_2819550 [Favolaschia claudopus]|uniref:Copper transport protein n=1 Tax=Favolaschia claudopus TaxID=2862362 RepID=A0AAW0EFP1_9AGAR